MSRTTKAILLGSLLITLIVVTILVISYDARDWVAVTLLTSEVSGAPPLPPFSVTPQDSGARALEFIAVGDAGTGAFGQKMTAEGMRKRIAGDSISFVLYLGDNFYEFGVTSVDDPQWQTKFEQVYPSPPFNFPFYPVLGNHDYRLNPQAQVDYTKKGTRWSMPARYYTFFQTIDDSTTVQFFCLDTNPMGSLSSHELKAGKDTAKYLPQLRWFAEQCSVSSAEWRIVAGHHPLYSNGDHGNNKELASLLEPLFVRHGIDVYVSGHDHDVQLLKPVQGVNYVVSGGGGKHRDVAWRENTLYAATNLGFVSFRISSGEILLTFFNRSGSIQYAHHIPNVARQTTETTPN